MDPLAPLVAALTHSGFAMGKPLSKSEWMPLLEGPADQLEARAAASKGPSAQEALASLPAVEEELYRLREQGVFALTWFDARYPPLWMDRLRGKAPPIVFGAGPVALLERPSLAILGSRAAPEAALKFASDCGRAAAEREWTVASGGAKGVDFAGVHAACEAGGCAIVLCADALQAISRRLLQAGCEPGQVLCLTSFHPDSGFSVGQAMGRNKLVYGLAQAAVIAACESGSGGTWTGAVEALRAAWCPVLAWQGPGAPEGNSALVREGALPILDPSAAFDAKPPLAAQEPLF